MFRTKKLSKRQRLPLVFGTWNCITSEYVVLYSFRFNHRNSRFPLLLLYKIEKYFSILRGETASNVRNGTPDIASKLKRVLTKWRSFFVTKMAYIKRKSWKIRIFYFLYSILRFHCILLYWFQAIFVLWAFFTSPLKHQLFKEVVVNLGLCTI